MKFDKILLRYGEIGLKSKQTRRKFEDRLRSNIEKFLEREKVDFNIKVPWGRFLIETKDEKALDVLKNVFGIVSISPVVSCKSELSDIRKTAFNVAEKHINEKDSFAVRARRTGNHEFTSQDVEREIGADIVEKIGSEVDLDNPDKELFIEVRQKESNVFTEKIQGPGGLPYGVEGKVLAVYGSSIDNLKTAVWLMSKRGCEVEIACLESDFQDVEKAVKDLKSWYINLKVHKLKENLFENTEKLAEKQDAKALVSAKSLTVENLEKFKKVDINVKLPVLRPLIGLDEEHLSEYKKSLKG
ncbi:MAG: THUMP domain-containing protein [Candidatus Undinarchaeales archaeon]